MTNLARFVVQLDGWSGGPGVNVFHFSEGTAVPWDTQKITGVYDVIRGIYSDNNGYFTGDLNVTVDEAPSIIDVATGEIVNVISVDGPPGPVNCSGTDGTLSRADQVVARYNTDTFQAGRRLVGHTYFGPADASVFGQDGLITAACRASFIDSFVAMTTGLGPRLCVYSRPNAKTSKAGSYADVSSVQILATPGTLRSRKT